jgi:hypothetical protein
VNDTEEFPLKPLTADRASELELRSAELGRIEIGKAEQKAATLSNLN